MSDKKKETAEQNGKAENENALVQNNVDQESQLEKLPYPKSVFFIVSNEFCERFSYYGMRTILSLYLIYLGYGENKATIIYHVFVMFVYFFPVFGAMLADSLLGKFRTIFYVSIIYAIGNIVLAVTSIDKLNLAPKDTSMIGLLLIAIGTGGIKPCVAAFGGDQFRLPQQALQLSSFFSMFYFSINAGSLISTAVTPVLRARDCLGQKECYPLAFGVPGILMMISIVIFVSGKRLYRIVPPAGNMVLEVSKCITHAIKNKIKNKNDRKEHWLDHAVGRFDKDFVNDLKATLKVLVLYIPLPVFWTLFDQQGTGWTFQARRMDGKLGGFYTILPDQMQVVNPLLILLFIPIFEYGIYPVLNKFHLLTRPLQRLVCGGLLAAISFAISASISLAIEGQEPILATENTTQLRIHNTLPCPVTIHSPVIFNNTDVEISPYDYVKYENLPLLKNTTYPYTVTSECENINGEFYLAPEVSSGYYFFNSELKSFVDSVEKHEEGLPKVRTLVNLNGKTTTAVNVIYYLGDNTEPEIETSLRNTTVFNVTNPGNYTVNIGNQNHSIVLDLGGVYTVYAVAVDNDKFEFNNTIITEPNSIHMLWLLPQYIIITMGEIMFSITGLEFAYSQAPTSMKSVMQACWLLTTAFGNLLVVIIQSVNAFDKQSYNFFLYAGLMTLDMLIFALMAMRYKYVKKEESMSLSEVKPAENGIDNPTFRKGSDET